MSKIIRKSVLDDTKWFGIREGSSVVSYCEDCRCQRTHTCTDSFWKDDESWFVLLCDFCRFERC